MKGKYLVIIKVPSLDIEYDAYIPINKKIGTIKEKLIFGIKELSNGNFNETNMRLIDSTTSKELENNMFVKESGIKNGSIIIIA